MKEMPVYVVVAVCLCLIVLLLAMDSLIVPVLFLLCIGVAVLYNLGSNVFLGEISYITKALTAVLPLGVTMDYSIFLLNSYEENKARFEGERERAMAHAINATFESVIGSFVKLLGGATEFWRCINGRHFKASRREQCKEIAFRSRNIT